MSAIDKAETLRQEAIHELLEERNKIDDSLKLLGYGKDAPVRRRGRPKKEVKQPEVEPLPSLPDTSQATLS